MKRFNQLRTWYGVLLNGFCIIAALAAFFIMILATANSFSRTFLDFPVPGAIEFTKGLLTVLIFGAMARMQFLDGHVKSLAVVNRLKGWPRWCLQLLAPVAGLVFSCCVTWGFWQYSMESYSFHELEIGAFLYPLYPFKFIATLGFALLSIEYFLETISMLLGGVSEAD